MCVLVIHVAVLVVVVVVVVAETQRPFSRVGRPPQASDAFGHAQQELW